MSPRSSFLHLDTLSRFSTYLLPLFRVFFACFVTRSPEKINVAHLTIGAASVQQGLEVEYGVDERQSYGQHDHSCELLKEYDSASE